MTSDLLFELGCEELPSGSVWSLADALTHHFVQALNKANLHYLQVKTYATPRRLALFVEGLDTEQSGQVTSRRGPALSVAYDASGKPTPALVGFAQSCGVAIDALKRLKTEKGEWLVYEVETAGVKTAQVLPTLINQALSSLPIAKPMRWGTNEVQFARPVHWVVFLFGNEVIECDILGIQSGRLSYGHRFHHPQAIELSKPSDYERLLQAAYVHVDFTARRALIVQQVQQLALQCEAEAIMPDHLLDEVTSIVEWPNALLAHFDPRFLQVPAEALIAAMQVHQKCFALRNKEGQLLPHFITVANIARDNPQPIIKGNEKVMRARLSDAAFFFQHDQKQPLSSFKEQTEQVIFQARLGSLQDKARRLQILMHFLAERLHLDSTLADRAAELSKCDLMSGMVGEFPELQGTMGSYYARHDGEPEAVAVALEEQYRPRFANDDLPRTELGLALSLADRIDTLVGIFALEGKPSGVKDPFKLRRHALAVVRLLLTIETPLCLSDLLTHSFKSYSEILPTDKDPLMVLKPFIFERLQSYYQSQGLVADWVYAVRARQEDWLADFDRRIHALKTFTQLPQALALSAASKRVSHLLVQVKQEDQYATVIDESLLEEHEEKMLFKHLSNVEQVIKPLYELRDYTAILNELASLREPIDVFFDRVMVLVDQVALKTNRLRLLSRLQSVLQGVADISIL